MKTCLMKHAPPWLLVCALAAMLFALPLMEGGSSIAADKATKKINHVEAFKIYQQKCLGCHDSIADPEKPGRTWDEWHLVVTVMHGYGLGLTPEESHLVTDLLYALRSGIEKEAG